ncbi:MAG: hypothetical protein AAGA37_02620 [Actinomycetota bacterium]
MTRAMGNLVMVLVAAVIITIVLAFMANNASLQNAASDDAEPSAVEDPPSTSPPAAPTTTVPPTTVAPTTVAPTTVPPSTGPPTSTIRPATDATGSVDNDDEQPETSVLGETLAQESSGITELPDTGLATTGRWVVIATAIMAIGGLARNAGRDHADGDLALLP